MTQDQATKVLRTASGHGEPFTKAVRVGKDRHAATHAATHAARDDGTLVRRNKARPGAWAEIVSDDLSAVTCRSCRSQLKLYESEDTELRLEALFVLAITLRLRPTELRKLTWDLFDLNIGVVHVWRSTSRSGDVKHSNPSGRSSLPKLASSALQVHMKRQAVERLAAGELWQDHDLVLCNGDGMMYRRDALNWRFSKVTKRAGTGTKPGTPPCRS